MRGERYYPQEEVFLLGRHVSDGSSWCLLPRTRCIQPSVLIRIYRTPGERLDITGLQMHHPVRQEEVPKIW